MNTQVRTESNQKFTITDNNYLTAGGEAEIYVKDPYAFKIYLPNKITSGLNQKVKELSVLSNNKNIIAPVEMLYENNNAQIGYIMPYLAKSEQLNKLFTQSYKVRNNIDQNKITAYLNKMIDTIHFIHDKKILMVDGNEYNYLFNKNTDDVYFIDVDSYQTKSFPAKVIMPSIRDYHNNGFTELTDWFSFAIVSFQMLIGVHPFKGSHPDYTKRELDKRMKNQISVFNKDVALPNACADLGILPKALETWYFDLFEKGKRTLPPKDISGSGEIKAKEIYISGGLNNILIDRIKDYSEKKWNEFSFNGKTYETKIGLGELFLQHKNHTFSYSLKNIKDYQIIDDRIYVVIDNKFIELDFYSKNSNDPDIAVHKTYYNILPNSYKLFNNVLVYEAFGKYFFVIPTGKGMMEVKNFNDLLNGKKIFDAAYIDGMLEIIYYDKDRYSLALFHKDNIHEMYKTDLSYPVETNIVVLSNGIVICFDGEDFIISHIKKREYKIIKKVNLPLDLILYNDNIRLIGKHKNEFYHIKMK